MQAADNWPKGEWKKPSQNRQKPQPKTSALSDVRETLQAMLDHGIPAPGSEDRVWLSSFMSMERLARSAIRQIDQIQQGVKK